MCNNKIEQYVPRGYDYVAVTMKCGNTGIHGEPLFCESCEEDNRSKGHLPHECKHGKDMRPEGAYCVTCEEGHWEER